MANRKVRFAADSLVAFSAEPVQDITPEDENGQPAYVDPPSPPPRKEPDIGDYRIETPPLDKKSRNGLRLSSIEEVPEEEEPTPRGTYVAEPVEKPDVRSSTQAPFPTVENVGKPELRSGIQFPFKVPEIPEKELTAYSRFLEVEPFPYKKVKPGDFLRTERVLPPIRRGVGDINEVGLFREPERTDDLDRTYEAVLVDRPDISDDLDRTYRIKDKTKSRISYYGLTHSVVGSKKPHFSDLHITFSPEPIENRHFDRPVTHTLEMVPTSNPRKVTRPYKLEPIERETKRGSRHMACSVEPIEKPKPRKQVKMFPFMTEIATKKGHTRRYDLFARVPQEMSVQQPTRRFVGDLRSYRVVDVDSDITGGVLPDEVEHTIDTPLITEVDSLGSELTLGSDLTLGENGPRERNQDDVSGRWERVSIPGTLQASRGTLQSHLDGRERSQDDINGRWERVSIPGTLQASRGTLQSDSDGRERSKDDVNVNGRWERVSIPGTLQASKGTLKSDSHGQENKSLEQRWETVSLSATLAGSRGTLNIDDGERLYGKLDRSERRDSTGERWERRSTKGTLKGSTGTILEEDQMPE